MNVSVIIGVMLYIKIFVQVSESTLHKCEMHIRDVQRAQHLYL